MWRVEGERNGDRFCVKRLVVSRTTYRGGGGGGCNYRLPIDAGVSSDGAIAAATGPVAPEAVRVDVATTSGRVVASVTPISTPGEPRKVFVAIVEGVEQPVQFTAFDAEGRVIGQKRLQPIPSM